MNLKNTTKLLVLAGLILVVALSGCLGGDDPANNTTENGQSVATDVTGKTIDPANNNTSEIVAKDNGTSGNNNTSTASSTSPDKASSARDDILSENNKVLTFNFGATTGQDWKLTENKSGILSKTSDNYASGLHTWSFKGETPGLVTLNFDYSQASAGSNSSESRSYTIEVKDDKSMTIVGSSSSSGSASAS